MSIAKRDIERLMDTGTVAQGMGLSGVKGIDPRRRRFLYNPGIYLMLKEPRESGRQLAILPDGLIRFETATLKVENFNINVDVSEYQKEVPQEFAAAWFLRNVDWSFHDQGSRELTSLTMLDDPVLNVDGSPNLKEFHKSAQGYYNALHPTFAEVGFECPFGQTVCVTCRLSLLGDGDPESTAEIIRERMAKLPDQDVAEDLRFQLIEANRTYEGYARNRWATILAEREGKKTGQPGLGVMDESCHHVRLHIHEYAPEDQSAVTAAGFGAEVGAAQAAGMEKLAQAFRESNAGGISPEMILQMVETQKAQGELLAALTKKLTEK
jgi:hypothetical protein